MTLANTPIVNSYIGTGGANSYPFSFVVFEQTDLVVIVTSPTTPPVSNTLVLGTDYLVTGLNAGGTPPSNGSIVLLNTSQVWLTNGNLTTGWTLTITSNAPLAQNTSIRNQGDFYPEDIESGLDYLMRCIQQLEQSIINLGGGGGPGGGGGGGLTNPIIGDLVFATPGAGCVFKTPDGTKTYRIFIGNDGAISAQELT